jgi:hypothetical protein
MKHSFDAEALKEQVELFLANGYQVFYSSSQNTISYIYFVKDNKIGYCQTSYGLLKFSTVHKACKQAGTGYIVLSEVAPTLDVDVCFEIVPSGFKHSDAQFIKKYKDFDEYQDIQSWTKYIQITEV